MPVRQEIHEGLVPVKVYTGEMEPAARAQLVNISRLPIVHHHVAAMPDVHLGIGATVGSVIPTKRAIIPAKSMSGSMTIQSYSPFGPAIKPSRLTAT